MKGCVAAIDGLLLQTIAPPRTRVGNVASFHSGHCKHHGFNVQAACDGKCGFAFMSCESPGGTNDAVACVNCTLPSLIESLPAK